MPRISVIIPVYKAEKYLCRCVESIIFGEEQDLEVILVEDCSPDESWKLCQQLARKYAKVKCLRNERNSGVSYTRNRGLDAATGTYVLFVDSDDWVSGSYAKTLIETQEANPGKLVVCGFHFIDETARSRCIYGNSDVLSVRKQDFFLLDDMVLLQQLWNKVFSLELIRQAGIRFDETLSMGEDYRFVLDVLEASACQACVIIPKPLYYYIRWDHASLMSNWSSSENFEREWKQLEQLRGICGVEKVEEHRIKAMKERQLYRIATDRRLSGKGRREALRNMMHGEVPLKCYWKLYKCRFGNGYHQFKVAALRLRSRIRVKLEVCKSNRTVRIKRKQLRVSGFTVISQNCIGGVFCHDMGLPFQSPTVNLSFSANDFIRFVENLEHYLSLEPEFYWDEEYPVGRLGDLKLHCVHYDTCTQAWEDWERRKKRVELNKVLVLATDRDGFDAALFERWKQISYPKVLFTARQEFADHPDSVYFPEYQKLGCVPNLIPKRGFYKGELLMCRANRVGASEQ